MEKQIRLCDNCGTRTAKLRVTQMLEGKIVGKELCFTCSRLGDQHRAWSKQPEGILSTLRPGEGLERKCASSIAARGIAQGSRQEL